MEHEEVIQSNAKLENIEETQNIKMEKIKIDDNISFYIDSINKIEENTLSISLCMEYNNNPVNTILVDYIIYDKDKKILAEYYTKREDLKKILTI